MKLTQRDVFCTAVVSYALIGALAFGHCAANTTAISGRLSSEEDQRAMKGVAAGIFWPLYWSWVLFEKPNQSLE